VRLEGLGKLKNPMTSPGIKFATFWFEVLLCLNQLPVRNMKAQVSQTIPVQALPKVENNWHQQLIRPSENS
jgi:hypothetical protein